MTDQIAICPRCHQYFETDKLPVLQCSECDLADTEFGTEGKKFDSDKIRLELLPPELLFAVADILTFGAKKYDDRNWELGMKWSRVFGAAMRHAWAWWGGKGPTTKSFLFGELDDETGKSHLWHLGCCVAFLIAYEERGVGEDDRYTTKKN